MGTVFLVLAAVVFPAPLMSTIGELGSFLARETAAADSRTPAPAAAPVATVRVPPSTNGAARPELPTGSSN